MANQSDLRQFYDPSKQITPHQRTLLVTIRQALLMAVDAIEVYLGFEVRTAQLRKEKR